MSAAAVLNILGHRFRTNQRILRVRLHGRVHAVPFVEDAHGDIVLKTAYPSRKHWMRYGKDQETQHF